MNALVRPTPRGLFPDLVDFLKAPFAALLPHGQTIRFEEFTERGRYVLRAELPGVDVDKDVDVTVNDGVLTVSAHRYEEQHARHHTEFRYGSFSRSVTLPSGSDEKDVKATYDKGVLEVSVALREGADEEQEPTRIPIEKKS